MAVVLDTQETRMIGDAVTAYYGCVGCATLMSESMRKIVPLPAGGNEHKGVIQAPVGYTVCHAYVKDPSVNCNGTFTGSYRTADDPNSARLDGLHWYMVVPRPGPGQGRCWVEGTVVVEFVKATPNNPLRARCGKSGETAFHYGK